MIEIDDVKTEIHDYTGFDIIELGCTDFSHFIKASIQLLLFLIFILF